MGNNSASRESSEDEGALSEDESTGVYHEDTQDSFIEATPLLPDTSVFPQWARPRSVMVLVEHNAQKEKITSLRNVAGQALPSAFAGALLVWLMYPCFALLTKFVSACPNSAVFWVSYPWWSWSAVVPVWFACLYLQFVCLKYIAVPKLQVLEHFEVCCYQGGFVFLLFEATLISSTFLIDLASDSAFLGSWLKTTECMPNHPLTQLWQQIMDQSSIADLWKFLGHVGMSRIVMAAWLLGYSQLFFAVVTGLPQCCRFREGAVCTEVDFEISSPHDDIKIPRIHDYPTMLHWCTKNAAKQNHGAALMVIAEAAGMHGIVHGDDRYAYAKAKLAVAKNTHEAMIEAYGHVESQARRSVFRTALSGAISGGLQLNVSVTMLACACVLSNQHPMHFSQMLLTISLSLVTVCLRLFEGVQSVCKVHSWNERLKRTEHDDNEEIQELRRNLFGWETLLALCVLILFVAWAYAVAKCIGVWKCPQHVWNLSGCAHFNTTWLGEIVNQSMALKVPS